MSAKNNLQIAQKEDIRNEADIMSSENEKQIVDGAISGADDNGSAKAVGADAALEEAKFDNDEEDHQGEEEKLRRISRNIHAVESDGFQDISILIHYFEHVLFKDDEDSITFWAAYIYACITQPLVNPEMMLILYSKQSGTGKTTIGYLINALMGERFTEYELNARDLLADDFWQSILHDSHRVNMIQIGSTRNGARLMEQLKTLISSPILSIRRKNRPSITVVNSVKLIATTNVGNVDFWARGGRFAVWHVSEDYAEDSAYWTKVYAALNDNEKVKMFWVYLVVKMGDEIQREIEERGGN